ncbi:MAG: AMP-binding protein, partial [Planctomycetota bacterium]
EEGILFLPNHPALIDPVMLLSVLYPRFAPRVWAVDYQVDRFVIRRLADRVGVLTFPPVGRDPEEAKKVVNELTEETVAGLREGANFLIYPSGHAYRTGQEDLRGNSAAHDIVQKCPAARPVLVRTTGLWGSNFSWANGHAPQLTHVVKDSIKHLLMNGIFFAPRRCVTIEFVEADNLPRDASRETFNTRLEKFYNRTSHPPLYVPYTVWEPGPPARFLSEPRMNDQELEGPEIPESISRRVEEHLRDVSGVADIERNQHLGRDLGIDSVGRAELLAWLETEWGVAAGNAESVQSVEDLMLAATGEAPGSEPEELEPPSGKWFDRINRLNQDLPQARTLHEAFMQAARANPGAPIFADQTSGMLTYRRLLTAIFALKPHVEELPERIGIMLPASVGAAVVYLTALMAGKTPVMVNWTLGRRNVRHCVNTADVEHILTARPLTDELQRSGTTFPQLSKKFVYLGDLRRGVGMLEKSRALFNAWFRPGRLPEKDIAPDDIAIILFTSGSENVPKGVPLTHRNILANLRDVTDVITLRNQDHLLGMLPPFHSFGLTVTLLLPACLGVRTVYAPDPTDGATMAEIIDAYEVSLMVGTPTFLHHILRAPARADLSSLRLAVTGGEQCPEKVYRALEDRCPDATVIEGYGITECSPVVSVNDADAPVEQTIGKILPSLDHAIIVPETGERVVRGERGMLLLRGPSIFQGYLDDPAVEKDPFVEWDGKMWYETGDLVREREDGVLEFCGRLKRFVKIGGEMISLPAIESVLEDHFPREDGDPQIAVESKSPGPGRPVLILVTTRRDLDRQQANKLICDAGLSPLHNVKRVVHVEHIPQLGTGKTDHRFIREKYV